MKPIKKRLLLTIVLGGYLFFNVVLATHGFIILDVNPDVLLINQIDKPRWRIAYRFGTICPEEFREREEELKTLIVKSLRAWLQPLRDEFPGRAITDDFDLVRLEDFKSFADDGEILAENLWAFAKNDVTVTFSCQDGGNSFAAVVDNFAEVFMMAGVDIDHPGYSADLIHELGHHFGLGDIYVDHNKGRFSTGGLDMTVGKQPSSVMAALSGGINEDDRKGIIWLYKYLYEGQLIDDCFFSDYEFEEETGGCRPKYLVIYEVKNGFFLTVGWILRDDPTLDINERDADGFTALYHAVLRGHEWIVETLLEQKGIKVNILSKDKRTPAQLARELGHRNLARLIEAHPTAALPPWSVTSKGKLATTWGHIKRNY